MFYVYILISENGKRTYTGSTVNLQGRLKCHNEGKVKSSKAYRPYELLYCEEWGTEREAMRREAFYKSTNGRRKIKEYFNLWIASRGYLKI